MRLALAKTALPALLTEEGHLMRILGQTLLVTAVAVFLLVSTAHLSSARPIQDSGDTPSHHILLRPDRSSGEPYTTVRVHDAGNMRFTVTNWGVFGNPGRLTDPKTGLYAPGAMFPTGYNFEHLSYGALWIGAIVETMLGDDTLVTTAYPLTEFYPESYSGGGDFRQRTDDVHSLYYDPEAVSGQDFLCTYTDTLTDQAYVRPDPATNIPHKPLHVKVRQSSFVWPYEYAEDFVIIQYWITNLRERPLHEVRVGIVIAPSVGWSGWGSNDDLVGFLPTAPTITGYGFDDTVMTAWWADNNGDPYHQRLWDERSVRSVMGIRFLGTGRSPCEEDTNPLEFSFNWWAYHPSVLKFHWGPQHRPGDRTFSGGYGFPEGDAQKYRYMANREIDYDQFLANQEMPGWIEYPVPSVGEGLTYYRGNKVNLLLSVGPFELEPGDSIPFGLAIAAGDFFHRNPRNGQNLRKHPDEYYRNLNFTDLARNVQWAAWVYDTPGVDTDGDGCTGLSFVTNCRDTILHFDEYCFEGRDTTYCYEDVNILYEICDSIYYAGDGVPDLKGPPPPPSPKITIHTEPEKIHIRWDGREPELYFDPFAQREDFEGYNVYGGLGDNPNNLNLVASWDLVNYDRYRYVPGARPSPWVLDGPSLTPDQMAKLYGADLDPRRHTDKFTYFEDEHGNRFYFKPHGGNRGNEYIENGRIIVNPVQYVRTDSVWDENRHTWKLFGHYECTIDNLLPSQPYYFAVTTFDGGLAMGNLGPLESSTQANMQLAYPTYSPDYVEQNRLKVSVYPNPYKIDAGYRQRGFEDPNREGFKERTRRIHFVNLPPKATIKIFSLDGDLIRELHHPESRFSDTPSHTAWDLITRNTQAVVSGIYLYSVESEWGTQIGKIVIIK